MKREFPTLEHSIPLRNPPGRTFLACLWPRGFSALLAVMLAVMLSGASVLVPGESTGVAQARESAAGHEQVAKIASVDLVELPVQARRTLQLIRAGGPFPYTKDGTVFGNRERVLPRRARGYYTEYTVPTPGARNRGARRIVAGGDPSRSNEYYYTDDHYVSFRRIRTGDE